MPTPMVECIPNYSEARRPEVIEQIVAAIASVPGVSVLDRHSDLDHNRTVLTFVGAPQAIEEAAFQSIRTAAELIDLNQHQGEHPRIGATDVVPFVPIAGVTMQECVEMARRLGARVGNELQIPVYLYEEAATRADRQNLENIRRGQYEGLKSEILSNAERKPDFGPARLGPAGATVIGARHPLIAFNIYLTTDQVSIAQKIAKAVRNSSGGLHNVKALGLFVEGRAQVSMNLTNYRQTPIARVVETVRREAERYGCGIHHSEVVGLIPQEALADAALWYLQLDDFEPEQILETKLSVVRAAMQSEEATFQDRLASGEPAPGGGSAAAHVGATGAALVAMVARLTVGRKKYAAVEPRMLEMISQAEALRAHLNIEVERDAAGFNAVMAAMRLPKGTPQEQARRASAIENAMAQAAQVPLEVAQDALAVMGLALEAAQTGNVNAISDAASGMAMAQAALTSAGLNVRINAMGLQNQQTAQPWLETLQVLEAQAREYTVQLGQTLTERSGLTV